MVKEKHYKTLPNHLLKVSSFMSCYLLLANNPIQESVKAVEVDSVVNSEENLVVRFLVRIFLS